MTTLDCVEESVGRSVGSVGKAVGDPLGKRWKSVGIYPLNRKALVYVSCERSQMLMLYVGQMFLNASRRKLAALFNTTVVLDRLRQLSMYY